MFTIPIMRLFVTIRKFRMTIALRNQVFLIAIITAVCFSSCQKDLTKEQSVQAGSADDFKFPWQKGVVVKYGALIGGPDSVDDFNFQIDVANQLGVSSLRESVIVPNPFNKELVPELNTNYKVLLNFVSPGHGKKLVPFRTDTVQYKKDLNAILNKFTTLPVVSVIENEESNRFFYSGTALDYITELTAATTVMHKRNIKVANGAITNQGLNYLVYEDYLAQGKDDSAAQFMIKAKVFPDSPATQNRGAFIDTLLTNYKTMSFDYLNFHWKDSTSDTMVLTQALNYLRKRVPKKKIISNEMGEFIQSADILLSHLQVATDYKFPYIIWYSEDAGKGKKGKPLQNSDKTLTESGIAYKNYLADK